MQFAKTIREKIRRLLKAKPNDLAFDDEHVEATFLDYFKRDLSTDVLDLISLISKNQWSMTSELNLVTTALACRHVVNQKIPGDFVECGVWRGGHALLATKIFSDNDPNRKVYLFDTFSGMTKPGTIDTRTTDGATAQKFFDKSRTASTGWCCAEIDEVKRNFETASIPLDRVVFVKGSVEETLKSGSTNNTLPDVISILRLDTDWYESTKVELEQLWPILTNSGIMIVDDYGYWSGARKAVDSYFSQKTPFLIPIGNSARVMVKSETDKRT